MGGEAEQVAINAPAWLLRAPMSELPSVAAPLPPPQNTGRPHVAAYSSGLLRVVLMTQLRPTIRQAGIAAWPSLELK